MFFFWDSVETRALLPEVEEVEVELLLLPPLFSWYSSYYMTITQVIMSLWHCLSVFGGGSGLFDLTYSKCSCFIEDRV
jgi:hypothetical protein